MIVSSPDIEEFAKILIKSVRDTAVRNCDLLLRTDARSKLALRWKQVAAGSLSLEQIIPDAVDEAIFSLLHAIDEGVLSITLASEDGRLIDLTKEGLGELAGWYMGSGGWRAMYSQERSNDDFAEMNDS